MKDKIELTEKQLVEILKDALATDAGQKALVAAMDKTLESGRWEFPDDCIAGAVTNKVKQLDAMMKTHTTLLTNLAAKREGEPAAPTGRVDVLDKKGKK